MSTRACPAECQKSYVPKSAPTASQPVRLPAIARPSKKVKTTMAPAPIADGSRVEKSLSPTSKEADAAIQ